MPTKIAEIKNNGKILRTILEELRLLREEFTFFLPGEDLKDYSHPDRIKSSYKKAIKKYPPFPLWK